MKILSLFDGISCARVALERAKIPVGIYYASEIDEYAISIARKNWPDQHQIGNVCDLFTERQRIAIVPDIDLLIGGSPCQDLSIARRNRRGLQGEKSSLFYEYVRILDEVKPRFFILENVASMPDYDKQVITDTLKVEPIMIDAADVSAQNRKRLFWTNIPNVTVPQYDCSIVLRDIVDLKADRKWLHPQNIMKTKTGVRWDSSGKGYHSTNDRAYSISGKHPTIPTSRTITKAKFVLEDEQTVGILTWEEIEMLQGLPQKYTELPKNNLKKRGAVIGNGFNVDVIAHILSFIPKQ